MRGEETFWKRRSLLAFILLLAAFFLIWIRPVGFLKPVRGVLSTLTLPFQGLFAWSAFELSDVRDFFGSIGHLKSENAMLQEKNASLSSEVARLTYLEGENSDLRSLVGLSKEKKNNILPAQVIGRDSSGLSTTLTLNRGTAQGVASGMPVVTAGSVLIGKTTVVFPETAEVMLLPNPSSVVSAALATNDSKGVIRGDHGLGMIFDLALQSDELKPGAAIVTSGLGDAFPPGLLIGTIASVHPSPDRLFQQAIVISPVRFDALRFVAVILH